MVSRGSGDPLECFPRGLGTLWNGFWGVWGPFRMFSRRSGDPLEW